MARQSIGATERMNFVFTPSDREILERLARDPETPTMTHVIRIAIRLLDRQRLKSERKSKVAT